MTFPERLRETRQSLGMTQRQLASLAGVGVSTLGEYERGCNDPGAFALCCLADALGVSVNYLLGRTDRR